jgi:hypothetical protein
LQRRAQALSLPHRTISLVRTVRQQSRQAIIFRLAALFCVLAGYNMAIVNVDAEEWDSLFDRRSTGRTKIAKGALLFFGQQAGVRSCTVTDITNTGAGLRTHDTALIPLTFELSFDNFRTIRECRLIWRDGDYLGAAFQN